MTRWVRSENQKSALEVSLNSVLINIYIHFQTVLAFITQTLSFFLSWKRRSDAGPLLDVTVRPDCCSLSTEALDGQSNNVTALPSLQSFHKHVQLNSILEQTLLKLSPFAI